MISIIEDNDKNLSEVDNLIALILSIENKEIVHTSIKYPTNAILKSSTILSLYNAIESLITKILKKIHYDINNGTHGISNLNEQIQLLFLTHTLKIYETKNDIGNVIDDVFKSARIFLEKDSFNLEFNEMTKKYKLYSGNLDAKEIRRILSKYGIKIRDRDFKANGQQLQHFGEALYFIKKGRNILAHGEESFETYGRKITSRDLKDYTNDTKIFLGHVIQEVQNYLNNRMYIATSPISNNPKPQKNIIKKRRLLRKNRKHCRLG